MFKDSRTRWLVTSVVAATAAVVLAAPAGAWQDPPGGRQDGNGAGSLPPQEVQDKQKASILSNTVHEGIQAERRTGNGVVAASGTVVATMNPGLVVSGDKVYVPGVDANGASVLLEVSPTSLTVGSYIPGVTDMPTGVSSNVVNRDDVVTDKAAPSPAAEYIPGVTDSPTGVYDALGIDPTVVAATNTSDDSFNWNSDLVIGLGAALATALLMALGAFALVNQRRRRVAL